MKKRRKIITYNPKLKLLARRLRNDRTRAEIRLWQYLSGKQMMGYDFHRQKPLDNYIADFFCHELMLVIEVDGYSHTFEEVVVKDLRKEERLRELGITTLRFTDEEVMQDIDNVLRTLEHFILAFEEGNGNNSPQE
jgi:very-short-patch-repair endonuclease